MSGDKCKAIDRSWVPYGRVCGRPSKGISSDGITPKCGIHLAAERRKEKNANSDRDKRREQAAFEKRVQSVLKPLGVRGNGTTLNQCIVDFDELEEATKPYIARNVAMHALQSELGGDPEKVAHAIAWAERDLSDAED